MKTCCFTSITFSYLNRARVLGATLKRHHPNWDLWLVISDVAPSGFHFDIEQEMWDRVIWATELDIPDIRSWIFKHDVVELCTAVKGPFLKQLCSLGYDQIFYLDPDIAVLNSLNQMQCMLENASILLTPHQLAFDNEEFSILDNELSSLVHGVYNLGFIAIRNDCAGIACVEWWSERCRRFCYDDKARGLFVDQKWCDLIPAFFDKVLIVRDPGYNVASWNLNRRSISVGDHGTFFVNREFPLRFYHFTKLGPIGDTMTRRYAGSNIEVYELWAWYKRLVEEFSDARIPDGYWFYGTFSSGNPIPKAARELYRYRGDLHDAFPDPFDSTKGGYEAWYEHEHLRR